jgi:hypothetical protein
MNTRTTTKMVTFWHPFHLDGIEGLQPPGHYTVDTDEQLIASSTRPAWRRVATTITLVRGGTAQAHSVNPVDLESSLMRDAGLTVRPPGG